MGAAALFSVAFVSAVGAQAEISRETEFVSAALGPADATAVLTRSKGAVRSTVHANGLSMSLGRTRVAITSTHRGAGSWDRYRSGAARSTSFGRQTVVFAPGSIEELLTVTKRTGPRVWRWRLNPGALTPRLGVDGGISFGANHALSRLAITPAKIFSSSNRDVTPRGTRWSLRGDKTGWWLELAVDDSRLPLPYVIDPAITYRSSVTATSGSFGGTSITLNLPTGIAARDLLVAQVATRGARTISTPTGWTKALDSVDGTNLRQATFYRTAATAAPGPVTFTFSASTQAVGGVSAYYGLKTTSLIDRFPTAASVGGSSSATAAGFSTQAPGSLVVSAFAAANGTTFGTPSGMTERYDATSASSTISARASIASHSFVQATAGWTGSKTATLTSSRWLRSSALVPRRQRVADRHLDCAADEPARDDHAPGDSRR